MMSFQIFDFVCGFHRRFVTLCDNLTSIMVCDDAEFVEKLILLNESLETLCEFLLTVVPVGETVFSVLHAACSFDHHVCKYI